MNAVRAHTTVPGLSHEATNLQWLLENFVEEVPGVRSVAVVSSDGLLLLTSRASPRTADRGAGGGPRRGPAPTPGWTWPRSSPAWPPSPWAPPG